MLIPHSLVPKMRIWSSALRTESSYCRPGNLSSTLSSQRWTGKDASSCFTALIMASRPFIADGGGLSMRWVPAMPSISDVLQETGIGLLLSGPCPPMHGPCRARTRPPCLPAFMELELSPSVSLPLALSFPGKDIRPPFAQVIPASASGPWALRYLQSLSTFPKSRRRWEGSWLVAIS